jgi:hypothetical protein
MKQAQLAERSQKDPAVEQQIEQLTVKVRAYEAARAAKTAAELAAEQADEMKKAGIVRLGIKRSDSETIARI